MSVFYYFQLQEFVACLVFWFRSIAQNISFFVVIVNDVPDLSPSSIHQRCNVFVFLCVGLCVFVCQQDNSIQNVVDEF